MLFNSLHFFFFLSLVYPLYLVLNHRWQNRFLVVASCVFYATWNWKFLFLLFLSVSVDFFCSHAIVRTQDQFKRKIFLLISLITNLSILGFFKYFNFFVDNLLDLLKLCGIVSPAVSWTLHIILPLGISFYTFEAISYIVDVYKGRVKPAVNYWDYILFVIYFPHLIAGPIMRAKDFLPQIEKPRSITADQFFQGCHLFFWGLFEKVFVADNLAKLVNPVFAESNYYSGSEILLALYAFSFQIFCDFDGYSNMARGLGKMMGFEITINFKFPYFSTNPREFWQRWHISLSTWLRDYLYIPLGGDQVGRMRTYLNLLITFLLGGLWHGASWTFVCWGLYWAIILIGYRMIIRDKENSSKAFPIPNFLKIIFFFHLTALSWLFFRSQSLGQVKEMVTSVFFNFGAVDIGSYLQLSFYLAILLFIQVGQYRTNDVMYFYKMSWGKKIFLYALMTYLALSWGVLAPQEFLYFQF